MCEELDTNGEDFFMSEVLNESAENGMNDSLEEMPFGLNRLLRDPLKLSKTRLDFSHVSQTPRNSFTTNDRKRKNPTRRCLSEVLNNSSYNSSPELDTSPTFLSKEKFMSNQSSSSNMTPIFTKVKAISQSPNEDSENISSAANTSTDSLMNCSPMLSSADIIPIKRPAPHKIRKSNSLTSSSSKKNIPFVRWHSANEAQIMKAVQISCADPSLIGDFSKSYALPLVQGKHQDLKSISADVLAQVLEGHYTDLIQECVVVDCRYPYEYNGGHIKGAKNLFSQEAILKEFIRNQTGVPTVGQNNDKRQILVFHCEFSSERGPTLSRFLRNNDRSRNKDLYPQLHHPEIYLLEGGYKAFFEKYRHLCDPPEYLPMHSKDHEHELKRFRAIVKSLSTDGKGLGSVYKTCHKGY